MNIFYLNLLLIIQRLKWPILWKAKRWMNWLRSLRPTKMDPNCIGIGLKILWISHLEESRYLIMEKSNIPFWTSKRFVRSYRKLDEDWQTKTELYKELA